MRKEREATLTQQLLPDTKVLITVEVEGAEEYFESFALGKHPNTAPGYAGIEWKTASGTINYEDIIV